MSDTDETLIAEPYEGDQQTESEVEQVDETELLADEIDLDDGDAETADDEIEIGGKKWKAKEAAEILAKADNLQRDYTKDKMALAEEKRRIGEIAAQRDDAIHKYGAHVAKLSQEIDEFNAIDWDAVEQQYPEQIDQIYSRAQRAYLKNLREAQELESAREGLIQQRTSEEVQEALRSIPEIRDPAKRAEFLQKTAAYVQQFGLDTSFVSNHKVVKMLAKSVSDAEKAAKYDAIVEKAKSKARPNASSNAPEPMAPIRSAAAPKSGLSDDLPMDEWLKRREAELKRQKRR